MTTSEIKATKRCIGCGRDLPLDRFYRATATRLQPRCKSCANVAEVARQRRKREAEREAAAPPVPAMQELQCLDCGRRSWVERDEEPLRQCAACFGPAAKTGRFTQPGTADGVPTFDGGASPSVSSFDMSYSVALPMAAKAY